MKVYNDRNGFLAEDCSYIDSALRYHIDMVYGLIEVAIGETNIYIYYFLKR